MPQGGQDQPCIAIAYTNSTKQLPVSRSPANACLLVNDIERDGDLGHEAPPTLEGLAWGLDMGSGPLRRAATQVGSGLAKGRDPLSRSHPGAESWAGDKLSSWTCLIIAAVGNYGNSHSMRVNLEFGERRMVGRSGEGERRDERETRALQCTCIHECARNFDETSYA